MILQSFRQVLASTNGKLGNKIAGVRGYPGHPDTH